MQIADVQAGMTVLEVGPGKGIITRELAKRVGRGGRVVAAELDGRLAAELRKKFSTTPQIEVVQQNILQFDLQKLGDDYHIVSNVPFNITADLLPYLLNPSSGARTAHLILQRDALTGRNKSGQETETFKSLLIKPLYTIAVAHRFSKTDFSPKPSVETALFAFERRTTPLIAKTQYDVYADFLAFVSKDRVGEGAWRKLFGQRQLMAQLPLQHGRGLKSQSIDGILAAFTLFAKLKFKKQKIVSGALKRLREEQQRRLQISRAGGHHRSRRRPRT